MATHYDILKIEETATPQDVKAAYRINCLIHHPDRNPGDPNAGRAMQLINDAYDVLWDSVKRRAYDEELRQSRSHFRHPVFQGPVPPISTPRAHPVYAEFYNSSPHRESRREQWEKKDPPPDRSNVWVSWMLEFLLAVLVVALPIGVHWAQLPPEAQKSGDLFWSYRDHASDAKRFQPDYLTRYDQGQLKHIPFNWGAIISFVIVFFRLNILGYSVFGVPKRGERQFRGARY